MDKKLPRAIIMRDEKVFQDIYEKGYSVADRYMVLHILPQAQSRAKVGFAAGKKLGNAVVRNHVKRMLREVYRHKKHRVREDCCIFLVGRKAAVTADLEMLHKSFRYLCKKGNIWKMASR